MTETRCTCGAGHETYGACLRAKGIRIGYSGQGGGDATAQKQWDKNLQDYRDARAQGINPEGSQPHQIRKAVELSNRAGKAFDAATGRFN